MHTTLCNYWSKRLLNGEKSVILAQLSLVSVCMPSGLNTEKTVASAIFEADIVHNGLHCRDLCPNFTFQTAADSLRHWIAGIRGQHSLVRPLNVGFLPPLTAVCVCGRARVSVCSICKHVHVCIIIISSWVYSGTVFGTLNMQA